MDQLYFNCLWQACQFQKAQSLQTASCLYPFLRCRVGFALPIFRFFKKLFSTNIFFFLLFSIGYGGGIFRIYTNYHHASSHKRRGKGDI